MRPDRLDDDRRRPDDGRRLAGALITGTRVSSVALAVCGGALVVASFLPAFELVVRSYTGSGASQQGYDYSREVSLVELSPLGLFPAAAGALVVAGAVVMFARGASWWVAVGSLVLALGLVWLTVDTSERLGWSEGGVIGYDEPRGGPLLQPVVDDLQAEARTEPAARDPTWTLLGGEHAYASRGKLGWTIVSWALTPLVWLTGYRVARLAVRRLAAVAIVGAATVVFWLWMFFRALGRLE